MKKKKKRQRNGVPSDIAKLDFHDWYGNLQDRIRCKVNEKDKGMGMLDRIQERFGITKKEYEEFREKMLYYNLDSIKPTVKEDKDIKSIFKRNEKGKIVSPFDKKENSKTFK